MGLFTRDSGILVLSRAALPAVPDLQLLFTLDLPLQLQDAVEECLGRGRAAWGYTWFDTPPSTSISPHGGLSGYPGAGVGFRGIRVLAVPDLLTPTPSLGCPWLHRKKG